MLLRSALFGLFPVAVLGQTTHLQLGLDFHVQREREKERGPPSLTAWMDCALLNTLCFVTFQLTLSECTNVFFHQHER